CPYTTLFRSLEPVDHLELPGVASRMAGHFAVILQPEIQPRTVVDLHAHAEATDHIVAGQRGAEAVAAGRRALEARLGIPRVVAEERRAGVSVRTHGRASGQVQAPADFQRRRQAHHELVAAVHVQAQRPARLGIAGHARVERIQVHIRLQVELLGDADVARYPQAQAGAVDIRAAAGLAVVAVDAEAAVQVVRTVAAADGSRIDPRPGLVLQHHARITDVAAAARAAVVGAQAVVLVGRRAADEPARAELALPADLIGVAVEGVARRALYRVLVGAAARRQAPETILLAPVSAGVRHGRARHHRAGEARLAGQHLRGRRQAHAGRQVGQPVAVHARPLARRAIQYREQRRQLDSAALVPDLLQVPGDGALVARQALAGGGEVGPLHADALLAAHLPQVEVENRRVAGLQRAGRRAPHLAQRQLAPRQQAGGAQRLLAVRFGLALQRQAGGAHMGVIHIGDQHARAGLLVVARHGQAADPVGLRAHHQLAGVRHAGLVDRRARQLAGRRIVDAARARRAAIHAARQQAAVLDRDAGRAVITDRRARHAGQLAGAADGQRTALGRVAGDPGAGPAAGAADDRAVHRHGHRPALPVRAGTLGEYPRAAVAAGGDRAADVHGHPAAPVVGIVGGGADTAGKAALRRTGQPAAAADRLGDHPVRIGAIGEHLVLHRHRDVAAAAAHAGAAAGP